MRLLETSGRMLRGLFEWVRSFWLDEDARDDEREAIHLFHEKFTKLRVKRIYVVERITYADYSPSRFSSPTDRWPIIQSLSTLSQYECILVLRNDGIYLPLRALTNLWQTSRYEKIFQDSISPLQKPELGNKMWVIQTPEMIWDSTFTTKTESCNLVQWDGSVCFWSIYVEPVICACLCLQWTSCAYYIVYPYCPTHWLMRPIHLC